MSDASTKQERAAQKDVALKILKKRIADGADRWEMVIEARANGLTYDAIGAVLGVTPQAVYYMAKRDGPPRRKRPKPKRISDIRMERLDGTVTATLPADLQRLAILMGIIYMTPLAAKRSHFTSSGFKLRRTIRRKSLAYLSGIGSPLAYPWLVRMDTPRNSAAPA